MVTRTAGRLLVPRLATTSGGTTRPVAVLPPCSSVARNLARGVGWAPLPSVESVKVTPSSMCRRLFRLCSGLMWHGELLRWPMSQTTLRRTTHRSPRQLVVPSLETAIDVVSEAGFTLLMGRTPVRPIGPRVFAASLWPAGLRPERHDSTRAAAGGDRTAAS